MSNDERFHPGLGDALLVVDVQNDFLPGGALGISEAEGLIETINAYVRSFQADGLTVVATRDWHPATHCSFEAEGGPWPEHCVADTIGAAFPTSLQLPESALIVSKGTARSPEAYSGFQGTQLAEQLRSRGVRRLFLVGIATDYCVHATALDAIDAGFDVVLLEDGMRAVDVTPGDGARAIDEVHAHGGASGELALLED